MLYFSETTTALQFMNLAWSLKLHADILAVVVALAAAALEGMTGGACGQWWRQEFPGPTTRLFSGQA